ncbi:RnfH family protein [Acidovorax carolinensis]|uniref:RnfH family protein n=1 Tax=Acidovorax carolinensis TaxID=553814 RepID=UPI000B346E82|nr:RnfH family protein [Acidovorax carolinensis]ART48631.1 RnfH family protein [Acidovorax carolinensis]
MGDDHGALQITVVVCMAPRSLGEWTLQLPAGATVSDALKACEAMSLLPQGGASAAVGIWGRQVALDCPLAPGDRVEVYRPLKVDPKVARRERFARQGARTTGLFARQRPGGKSGY